MDISFGEPPFNPRHKVMILAKPSKNRSLQGFKEAIIKHQPLASDFQKEEWGKKSVCNLSPHNLWYSYSGQLVGPDDFKWVLADRAIDVPLLCT